MTQEERKRSQTRKSNGWLATLGGALVLIAVGFGVGLVAGTAYEEPELVGQHLAGRTTDVALGPIDAGADFGSPASDVAAAPPLAEPEAVLEPATPLGAGALDEAKPPPARTTPATAAPVVAGAAGFSIQVGAFGSDATARDLAGQLEKRGYPSYVASEGAGARFKVRVGPLASRVEAERVSQRLQTELRLPTWILAASAPPGRAQ